MDIWVLWAYICARGVNTCPSLAGCMLQGACVTWECFKNTIFRCGQCPSEIRCPLALTFKGKLMKLQSRWMSEISDTTSYILDIE